MEKTLGIAAERLLPPYARTRFSTWLRTRPDPVFGRPRQAQATVFPTCLVEYQNPAIGKDLVKVYEHNGIACRIADGAGCCGAPWLHSGELVEFRKQAQRNVRALARSVREGNDIVVPQPTCGYVLKQDYVDHVERSDQEDAKLVAEHTYDACEYLWRLRRADPESIDTEFPGDVPETTTYHVPCHLRAQNIGLRSRDLLKLTGTKITLASECSGIDGMWGYRKENYALAREVAKPLIGEVREAGADAVVGDCQLANGVIRQETGAAPMHPLQFLARAYGIGPDE
jgi:Fe-S oxidoreductase